MPVDSRPIVQSHIKLKAALIIAGKRKRSSAKAIKEATSTNGIVLFFKEIQYAVAITGNF